jgi:hypothetical protein
VIGMPLFKRKAEFKVVKAEQQPTEQAAQSPPPVPLPLPEPKSPDETELESIKQRWAQALHDYAYGRFSGKTLVLDGKPYYRHMVLETSQGPNYKQETFIGLNGEMAPCLVTAKFTFGPPASGIFKVDVEEELLNPEKAKAVGLTPEEALRILEAMEKFELSW